MIPIPDSVVITRHQDRESELYVKGREWLEKDERTPGIHASGLLDPLQAYWQAIDPLPLSDRLVAMFLVGKVLHAFVLGSYTGDVDVDKSDGGSSRSNLGFDYSPDLLHDGIVRELKTSRSYFEPKDLKDVSMYVEQLLTYQCATNTTESELWVLYLNLRDKVSKKTAPAFRCYTVSVSQADLDKTKDALRLSASQLAKAIETKDPSGLELCRSWKCGNGNCDWYMKCQPEGRFGTAEFDK